MNSDVPICTFYLKNACDRGRSCSFSHQRPVFGQKSSQPVCRYFLQGNCAYGEKCPRSHNAKGRTKSASSGSGISDGKKGPSKSHRAPDDEQESDRSEATPECEGQAVAAWGSGISQLPEEKMDSPSDQPEKLKAPCMFHSQGLLCGKGDECEFSHSDPSGPGPSTNGKNSYRDQERSSHYQPASKKICKHYQRGDCRLGKECRDIHVLSDLRSKNLSSVDHHSSVLSSPSVDRTRSINPEANQKDSTEHDSVVQEGNHADYADEDIGYASSRHEDEDEPVKSNFRSDRSALGSEGGPKDVDDHRSIIEEPKHKPFPQPRKSKGPGSYYGDGWEEREVPSSPSPPPPLTKRPQQQTINHINSAVRMYPHISEVRPHWSQFADPLANPETPFCKPHAQGQCMLGHSCRFRHSLTPAEYILLFKDQQPNLWTLERDPDAASQSHGQIVQQPSPISASSAKRLETVSQIQPLSSSWPAKSSLAKECVFYPLGRCRNGDKCPFQHVGPPPEAPDTAPLTSDQDWGTNEQAKFDQVRSNRPCKFFTARGVCNNGESCKFRHGDISDANYPSSGASGPQSSPEPAKEENDNGWNTPWEDNNNKEDDGWDTKHEASDPNDWTAPVDHSGWGTANDSKGQSTWTARTKSKQCYQFAQHGQCRYADKCNFSHDVEPKEEASQQVLKISDQPEWPPTDHSSHSAPWVVSPRVPCPYFQKGECRNGSECSFLHDPLPKPESTEEETENREIQESEVEAPPTQEQSETLDDGNDTWSKPWPAEPETGQPSRTKINAPCKHFGQGYCKFTDEECRYRHIINTESGHNKKEASQPIQIPVDDKPPSFQVDDPVEISGSPRSATPDPEQEQIPEDGPEIDLPPIVFDHPTAIHFIMNCEVTIGADSTPREVKTASDTQELILSDLPLDVSPTDIESLARPYGEIQESVATDETADSTTIKVEFATVSQAVDAFQHLDGQTFQSRMIVASLGGRTRLAIRFPNQKLVLKVSWSNASVSAWSHYQTISKAKSETARLNDVIFQGRMIKVTFVTPTRNQKESFAIKLDRLPVDATKADVEELCKDSTLVNMNRPTYSGEPTDAIRTSLDNCGIVDNFDILPGSDSRATSVAFVTFRNEQMADAAVKSLDGCNQEYLGQQPLTVRPVLYSRYRIMLDQFEAIKNELDRLIGKGGKKCTIQFSDHRHDKAVKFVRIYAPFETSKLFADINAELWNLIYGTAVKNSDGCDVWDDYFEIPSSAKFLSKLDTNAFIHCDHRTKQVRLYGSKDDCEEARKSVFKLLSKVRGHRHELDLPRPKLHSLVNGALANLQADIGTNKVSLDLINSKLIVRGPPAALSKANMVLDSLNPHPEPLSNLERCQICHHAPVNAVTLSCHHNYCTVCLQSAIRQTGHAPFPCIFRRELSNGENRPCSAHVPYVIIRDILAAEEKDILRLSLLSHVKSRPNDLFCCPSLNCKAVYRVGGEGITLKCSLCLCEICTHCKTPAHTGLTCTEINVSQ
ncbi:hypothetical protein GALMADRAFT_222112 [Galerina marginata CBS 339.88]|uniref:RING-type E3 ubiquitin transferase n=1 Tax=Galerina marginata (strain CBS 339.88) TaxID=685588 RepID=A0A067TDW1_GALM3|nr:hypothetical protein GALMADRAFT_222112 [Galerina marginata CBS 339.88]